MQKKPELTRNQNSRLSAKEFIAARRVHQKQVVSHQTALQELKHQLSAANHENFSALLNQNDPKVTLILLFTVNQVKKTLLMEILQHKDWNKFWEAVNVWSIKNSDKIEGEFTNTEMNELTYRDWQIRFIDFNRCVAEKMHLLEAEEGNSKRLVNLLGVKNGLYFLLILQFIDLDVVIQSTHIFKYSQSIIKSLFLQIFKLFNPMSSIKQRFRYDIPQIQAQFDSNLKSKVWAERSFLQFLYSQERESFHILKLQQMGCNFWHELARNDPKQFLTILQKLTNQSDELYLLCEKLIQILQQFDHCKENAIDLCLKLWNYEQINQLLWLSEKLSKSIISTNCLNKLLINCHLNQGQKEKLLQECLQGKFSKNGFIKMVPQIKSIKSKSKGICEVDMIKSRHTAIFDTNCIKMEHNKPNSYPLTIYLETYKEKASIRTIQHLFWDELNKDCIKNLTIQLYINQRSNTCTYLKESIENAKIQFLIQYYEPLWKIFISISRGEVFNFLYSHIHRNIFEIKKVSKGETIQYDLFSSHFIRFYVQRASNLEQDTINRQIVHQLMFDETVSFLKEKIINSLSTCSALSEPNYVCNSLKHELKQYVSKLSKTALEEKIPECGNTSLAQILRSSCLFLVWLPEQPKASIVYSFDKPDQNALIFPSYPEKKQAASPKKQQLKPEQSEEKSQKLLACTSKFVLQTKE